MSTQSEAKAHLDSMAGAARSYRVQEERIARLEARLEEADQIITFARPVPQMGEGAQREWMERRHTWLSRDSPTGSEARE